MTYFLFRDGMKQEIDEDIFERMAEQLNQTELNNPPIPEKIDRRRPDGTYDKRPLDPDYFKKYYKNNPQIPYQCPDCGRTISTKTNLSRHRNMKLCQRHRY